jgi:DNA-binding winged helix-turn-helix (wHTH) protein
MKPREAFCSEDSAGIVEHVVYVFEGFHLDITRRRLSSSGGVVLPLSSRAMDSLLLLVANAGHVVEKRRLMETVWPTAVVEDNNLNQCILAIRKALGETAGSNRYIMTVPGRGYCFVCPVQTQTRENADTEPDTPLSFARRMALTAAGVAPVACLLAVGILYAPGSTQDPDAAAEPSLVLRLRGANAVSPAALADCLALEPEMRLEVSVRLVRNGTAGALWSGQYVADQQDLLSLQEPADPAGGACAALDEPRQAARAVDAAAAAAAITSR